MAPRTYTRSQRPSQSQSQPRQSQRGHKSRIESDEEEEDQNYNGGNDMDVDEDEAYLTIQFQEISRKANQLVRLALFNENRRGPLRRDDISKKVMGGNARIFNRVFEQANATLKKTFGMELVELPSKASLEEEATGTVEDAELEEARKAVGGKKKATTVGSKQYIIRSILDPGLLDYASLMHESILNQEAEDLPSDDDDDDSGIRSYGSIFSWSTCDQLEAYGVLTVILSLILVSGKVMSDADLRNALKHLYLNNSSQIRFTALSTTRTMPLDRFLDSLMRQGYIDQQIVGEAKKKGGPGKRARQADDDTGVQYEWRWGPRAHSEFGEQGIAQFIAETMVSENQDDDDEEEGSSRGQRRRQEQAMSNLEKMLKGVQKAAGGILSDLK
uniref:MAGE domain-containing protein n=1 Tax=Moniliophthora roreri TaxID=221103 RepID=A0A0W0F617_MONRR